MAIVHSFINGSPARRTGSHLPIINPADEVVIGEVSLIDRAGIELAISSSITAFRDWKRTPAYEKEARLRQCALAIRKNVDEMARLLTEEQGKPLSEALGEAAYCADLFETFAGEAWRIDGRVIPAYAENQRHLAVKEPLGPVLVVVPWNFPLGLAAPAIAAGLAAGCSTILKGPEEAPRALELLVRSLHEAGLPGGLVNLLYGIPEEISETVLASPDVRGLHFTGSTPVGKRLAGIAATNLQRCVLELGGNGPVIICPDTDPAKAAALLAARKITNAGQVCTSPSRFFVHKDIHRAFVEQLDAAFAELKVGSGLVADSDMGPLAKAGRVQAMEAFVADAAEKGADLVRGGARIGNQGYFFAPTIIDNVPDDAAVMRDEIFGPIIPVQAFSDLDSVIAKANSSSLGLAGFVFGNSRADLARLQREIEVGAMAINDVHVGFPHAPFGGVKQSGYGRLGGVEGMAEFLTTKLINENDLV